MSLILEALRKMEQERKARQGGTLDIRPEVLGHRRTAVPAKRRALPFVAAGLLLAAGLGVGLFLRSSGKHGPLPVQLAARNGIDPADRPTAPPQLPPVAAVPPPAPLAQPAAVPQPAPAPPTIAAPVPPAPSSRPARRRSTDDAAPAITPAAAPGGSEINVSGIAWQDERSLRRAVINGALLGEGAEVAGARVVEIGERRVKFSRGGQTFSVTLSSPFPAR